ncbi:MAG: nuclease domain-containing protein [Candidatus Kapaibacterium sp.]
MSEFEVILISIDWESPDKVRSITPSKKFLEPSKIDGNKYEYDIVLYNKEDSQYFQFAIKTKLSPKIKDNGSWKNLWRIENTEYWIDKGTWCKGSQGKYYNKCQSINTIGKIEIGLRDDFQKAHFITIDINSNIDDFDFAQLKNDFEGELWNLITSNKSNVTSKKIEIRYSDKIFRYAENKSIIEFINAFDQIAKNPKRELSRTKEFRKTEKVIPIAETYRKLSTTGTSTLLPSKALVENHDIYENRFICFMLHSIYLIVSNNIKYTSLQIERYQNQIKTLNQKITILEDPDPKVNQFEIQHEIETQEEFYREWKRKWEIRKNHFIANYSREAQFFHSVTIEIAYRANYSSYWVRLFNNQGGSEYCLFEFNNDCDSIFEEQKGQRITLTAYYLTDGQAGRFNKYVVRAIAANGITLNSINYESIIQRQRANYNTLQANNWRQFSILSTADRNKFIQERNNQVQTLSKKIEKINFQIKNIGEFKEEQFELQPLLEQRLRTSFFKKIKWRNFQGFKPSMTFIQNISYRNALRYYKEVLKSEGLDIAVFDLYENVTSFGLRETPQVYELWCLVTIVKVLEESFHFAHIPKDLIALLKIIDPKKQTIAEYSKIDFKNSLAGRQVTLHYQKSIAENKRPDFILEIACNKQTINLVLDSKFKNYNYKKSIVYETVDMINKYGGNKNYVFILHPCKDGTYEDRNVKYTNHGGERIYYKKGEDKQIEFPFHEYGYIELKPNFTDNLKKLIAMSFEYLLEPTRNAKQVNRDINPRPENEMFCLNCGGTNITMTEFLRGDNRHYFSCTCNQTDCGHKIYIDYCWNCKTKLFKHGSYWDYHLESTWSIFDIRCPNCGSSMADRHSESS